MEDFKSLNLCLRRIFASGRESAEAFLKMLVLEALTSVLELTTDTQCAWLSTVPLTPSVFP